jgi:hypothetical protein
LKENLDMKLQTGKFYRTKAGRRVGPMLYESDTWAEPTIEQVWHGDGTVMFEDGDESHDYIVAEWEDTPKLWRDMTPEEKGALLLAHHEGKVIEILDYGEWLEANPDWAPYDAYRIRPAAQRPAAPRTQAGEGDEMVSSWW